MVIMADSPHPPPLQVLFVSSVLFSGVLGEFFPASTFFARCSCVNGKLGTLTLMFCTDISHICSLRAGKTSILRRYFTNSFEYGRRSTLGADFYSKRLNNPVYGTQNAATTTATATSTNGSAASLRSARSGSSDSYSGGGGGGGGGGILDSSSVHSNNNNNSKVETTASQRSLVSRKSEQHTSKNKTVEWDESLTEEPYINLQMWDTAGRERFVAETKTGISSTLGDAFFQHADAAILVYDATSSRSFTQLLRWYTELMERMKSNTQTRFPVIVVANKLDVIRRDDTKPIRRRIVPQRNVLDLGNGFRGKDHRYEYTVSSSPPPPPSSSSLTNERVHGNRSKESSLSYGLTDTTWTTDNSYLNSVIKSEDVSFPDRDMVILWCRRNGLEHVEVSALDGTGVSDAVTTMMNLALASINERKKSERIKSGEAFLQDYWKSRGYGNGHNGILDLTARYTPDQKTRCSCCCRLFPGCK